MLRAQNLRVQRGDALVVDGVSFDLHAGHDIALIGPNGAGKSTLVQALLGLLPHHGGSIELLGVRLAPSGQMPQAIRDQVAYLPQKLWLDGRFPLAVEEFVRLGCSPRSAACWAPGARALAGRGARSPLMVRRARAAGRRAGGRVYARQGSGGRRRQR